jgi:heme O synthase-like polyprenyltransferase
MGCILVFVPPILLISAILLLASTHAMLVGLVTLCITNLTWLCLAKQIFKHRDDPKAAIESPIDIAEIAAEIVFP